MLCRRQAKIVNGVTTSVLSDGDEEVAEYTGAGALLRRYIPGPDTDQPIAMVTPAGAAHTRSYFHVNRQGSTVAMSNDAGVMAEGPYTYDAYGQGPTSAGVPFKYTGRRLDPETGLYYYRARYYSASLGRFLQTDPIGYADQMNLYGYVHNDPANLTDPSGLCATIKNENVRSDCYNAREQQVSAASKSLRSADVRPGRREAGYIATFNEETGQVTVRTDDAAGDRSNTEIRYTDNQGNPLQVQRGGDGRIVGKDGRLTSEIVLVVGHSHPSDGPNSRDQDRANEGLQGNPADRQIVNQGIPLVIKTPSGAVKVFTNTGACSGTNGCVLSQPRDPDPESIQIVGY